MTKFSIFLFLTGVDAQKKFFRAFTSFKKIFIQDTLQAFFYFLYSSGIPVINYFLFFLQMNPSKKYFYRVDLEKIIFLSRIRLWIRKFFILLKFRLSNYFLMVKNFFYQLSSSVKYFLDGEMIILNFRTSIYQQSCKNFKLQEVVRENYFFRSYLMLPIDINRVAIFRKGDING